MGEIYIWILWGDRKGPVYRLPCQCKLIEPFVQFAEIIMRAGQLRLDR